MLKLIGAVLTIGAFSSIGLHCSNQLKKRCDAIEDMISAFEIIKSEISFNMTPLCEIMLIAARMSKNQIQCFFNQVHNNMLENGNSAGFREIWDNALAVLQSFNQEDKKVISDAAAFLGQYDAEDQINALNLFIRRLTTRLHNAQKEMVQKSRLYKAMGAGIGVIAVLLVL